MKDFYSKFYKKENTLFVIYHNINIEQVKKLYIFAILQLFWPGIVHFSTVLAITMFESLLNLSQLSNSIKLSAEIWVLSISSRAPQSPTGRPKVSANGNMSQYYPEHFKETIHKKVSANGTMSPYCPKNLKETTHKSVF